MLLALALAAATMSVDVPSTLGSELDKAKDRTGITILLPQAIETELPEAYGSLEAATEKSYHLVIGASEGCNGASVCGIANFYGFEQPKPNGGKKVQLAKGRKGHFYKSTCGANCSFPSIAWRQSGATYQIDYKEAAGAKDMKRLANAAIKAGPR